MIKTSIFLLLLLNIRESRKCPENCLFCPLGQSEKCSICDSSQNLFLNFEGNCAESEILDCDFYSVNGEGCRSCKEGFIF